MENLKNIEIKTLRKNAQRAFFEGIKAADPEIALNTALERNPIPPITADGKYIVISIGKAAGKMAKCFLDKLPVNASYNALVVTNFENVFELDGCDVLGASHPIPCENGLFASKEVISRLEKATEKDVVIMLVSGGASALLPAPVNEISLHDKIKLSEILLSSGFDIYQMNLVRQSVSRLKGGGVLNFAYPAKVQSYILSDVLGDDLSIVGSGPSVSPSGTIADARRLLISEGVFVKLPSRIREYLENTSIEDNVSINTNAHLIAGNAGSVAAMAKEVGAQIILEPLIGDVNQAVEKILHKVQNSKNHNPFAIAFGGETTVKLKGNGKGGRNQELALRFAIAAEKIFKDRPWCFLSGGTDGIDGPTDAAGGLVDNGTVSRIQNKNKSIYEFLENNDSYEALKMAEGLIVIGATGTNVADLQLLIVGNSQT